MKRKPKKVFSTERDFLKNSVSGLAIAIGAFLRALREQKLNVGWKDLSDSTGKAGILDIERGRKFPVNKELLQQILEAYKVKNVESLSELMISLEKFRKVVEKKRFK